MDFEGLGPSHNKIEILSDQNWSESFAEAVKPII